MSQMRDTALGLLRRTGPATAEVLDAETGRAYAIDMAAFVDQCAFGMENGREMMDRLFDEPYLEPGTGQR